MDIASTAKWYHFANFRLWDFAPKGKFYPWWHSPQTPVFKWKGYKGMVNLKRPVQIKFRVSQSEQLKIQERMHECGIKNQARYLRLMAINGCIIKPDYTEIKEMNYELHKIGVNINQIAKKVKDSWD